MLCTVLLSYAIEILKLIFVSTYSILQGVYFIGTISACNDYRLLECDVESPVFPLDIINMIQTPSLSNSEETITNKKTNNNDIGPILRSKYEKVFDMIFEEQGHGLSLKDLFGGDEELDNYWNNPDVQSQNRRRLTAIDDWIIPLDECTLIKTL